MNNIVTGAESVPGRSISPGQIFPSKLAAWAAAIVLLLPALATAITVDFETDEPDGSGTPLVAGDVIGPTTLGPQPYADDGLTITVVPDAGGTGPLMIFDSANPTGGDDDIGSPNEDCPGGGPGIGAGGAPGQPTENCAPLDNVLIISEDGDSNDPDDSGGGGVITFSFDQDIAFASIAFLDDVEGEVRTFETGGTLIDTTPFVDTEENGYLLLDLNRCIRTVEVELIGSGAIPSIEYEPAICGDLSLTKDDGSLTYQPGTNVTYTITVSNTGSNDIPAGSVISDSLPAGTTFVSSSGCVEDPTGLNPDCTLGAISAGSSEQVSLTLFVPEDFTGPLTNSASVSAPDGVFENDLSNNSDDDTDQPADISLEKVITAGNPYSMVNGSIDYQLTATNTGSVALSNVTISDPDLVTPLTCAPAQPAVLNPGDMLVCTGSHSVSQPDLNNGSFTNTATTEGTPTDGNTVSDTDQATAQAQQSSAIALIKSGTLNDDDGTPGVSEGDTISYQFTVENTGNVTLTNITLTDTVGGVTISGGPIASLAPSDPPDSTAFTGSYGVTQADVDSGSFTNTATVNSDEGATDSDDDVQQFNQNPAISLIKTGTLNDDDGTPGLSEGDTISYQFTVENIGNVTLSNITLTDTVGGVTISGGPIGSLAPSDPPNSTAFTGNYSVTQADIDSGSFTNTATVNSNEGASDSDDDVQQFNQNPAISLIKTGTLNDDDGTPGLSEGDTISYQFTVENTGNGTLTNITLTDTVGGVTISGGPIASLAPSDPPDSTTFTGSYSVTQADIDSGSFTNTATVNSNEGASDSDSDQQVFDADPSLAVVKTLDSNADKDGSEDVTVGDTLTYSVRVTNDGDTTLTDVVVSDNLISPDSTTCASLEVGADCVLTGTYQVRQEDAEAGEIVNTGQGDSTQTPPAEDEVTTPVAQGAAISLQKIVTAGNGYVEVGDEIDYQLNATNTGDVTLNGVMIDDPMLADMQCTPVQPNSLAPGEQMVCTGTYAVNQSDVESGEVTNVAQASGIAPDTSVVDDADQAVANGEIGTGPGPSMAPRAVPGPGIPALLLLGLAMLMAGSKRQKLSSNS